MPPGLACDALQARPAVATFPGRSPQVSGVGALERHRHLSNQHHRRHPLGLPSLLPVDRKARHPASAQARRSPDRHRRQALPTPGPAPADRPTSGLKPAARKVRTASSAAKTSRQRVSRCARAAASTPAAHPIPWPPGSVSMRRLATASASESSTWGSSARSSPPTDGSCATCSARFFDAEPCVLSSLGCNLPPVISCR